MRARNVRLAAIATLHSVVMAALVAAWKQDLLWHVVSNDPTGIVATIGVLYAIGMVRGIYISYSDYNNPRYEEGVTHHLAAVSLGLGLLGTIIGFGLMLGHLPKVDPGDVANTRRALGDIALGMRTALYTTGAGLIAQMILNTQAFIIEREHRTLSAEKDD